MSLPVCQDPQCTIHLRCQSCEDGKTWPQWASGWYNLPRPEGRRIISVRAEPVSEVPEFPKAQQERAVDSNQRDWPDLQFSATLQKAESDDYHAYFRLHEMSNGRDDLVADADHFVEAQVKWDGCSNWWFVRPLEGLHFCDKSEFARLSEAMSRCWDWAAELIPNWNG